ncbi:MAG: hypothetical protein ACRCX2_17920 [Paraclostridium sp.]
MSRPIINREDVKSKRTILNHRTIDIGSDIPIVPKDFNEMLDLNRYSKSIKRYDFEVSKFGVIENILDEYIVYLNNPEFLHRVKFADYQANVIKLNVSAIAHLMYGDINMAWSIPFLNDLVKHPSDLTFELLTKDGVIGFNTYGINALKELKKYKETSEQNEGSGDKEALFTLDAF